MDGGILDRLIAADRDMTLAINALHNSSTDLFWMMMSDKSTWIPLYVLTAAFLFWRLGWRKAVAVMVACGLTILACDQTAQLLKYSVARLRPCYSTPNLEDGLRILEGRGSLFGFFSAHAADSFGFALCICSALKMDGGHGNRSYKTAILLWAALVAISRVFVGKHYLGDVVTGTAIGCIYGWFFGSMAVRISAAIERRRSMAASRRNSL